MSVFNKNHRRQLQADIKAGRIDPDDLLPDLIEWIEVTYYNLFCNLETGAHAACPAARRGNAAYAHRQSQKKSDSARILRKAHISHRIGNATYSHLFFQTLTFDHKNMTFANLYIKSGLYIAEIVKRLYQSDRLKELCPEREARLNHIFKEQVFGLAPTMIIYRDHPLVPTGFQR